MEPQLQFYLFGPFAVWRCGERLPAAVWRTRKHAALLKILLGERGRTVPADRLIEWLWPDLSPHSGQANLYVGISLLRRVLEPALQTPADSSYILTRYPGYVFDASSDCWVDVGQFRARLSEAQAELRAGRSAQAVRAYEAAADLYRGDYLADDPYEDWAIAPREQLREEYLEALDQLHRLCLAAGDAAAALNWAQRALALDPCREAAHRQVMRAYYALGRQADALRQFERCRQILQDELGVEPMPRTLLLYQQMLAGQVELIAKTGTVESSLGRLPFVGREAELAVLRRLLDKARQEGCQVAVISGERGVGKTRLVEEFAAGVQSQGVGLRRASCHALEQNIPYHPLREALSEALSEANVPALVRDLGPWGGVVAGILPSLWGHSPDLVPPPALSPAEDRARLLHGLTRLVQALASCGPFLLFVDDLHWADGATLQALHHLSEHLGRCPVLLIGTCCSEELEVGADPDTPTLRRLLDSLSRTDRFTRLPLHRLSQFEVAALVAAMARSPHEGRLFSQRLYRETEGNPFFLAEMLRALFEQGVLYRDDTGAWSTDFDEVTEAYEELPIPATVREVVLGRCRQLSEQQQRVLATAAVIGRTFPFDLWRHATGIHEGDLVDILELCLARQLLVRQADGWYDFSHGSIREILYRELTPERRRILHRRVARALVKQGAESPAGEIAHHYLEAQMWRAALGYLEQAGEAALRLFAYQEAWPYFARACEMLDRLRVDEPQRRYAIARQMVHLCSVLGRQEEAGQYMQEALELAKGMGDPVRIGETLQALCRHHFVGGRVEQALELSKEAVGLSQRTGDVRHKANALRQHGYLCYRSGRHEEAFATLEEALRLSRLVGDRQIEAQNLNVLGVACYYHGDYARALTLWEQALSACREIDFKPVLAQVAGNLGEVYRSMGCYAQALTYRQEGLAVARAIGFRTIEPDSLLDIGMIYSDLGRHREAIPFVEEALSLAHEVGHRHFVVHALNGLARVRLRTGKGDEARQALALAEAALVAAREIGLRHGEIMALSLQGWALLALGQAEAACEASRAAVELLETQRTAEGDEPSLYYHHAQNLTALGKSAEAEACLTRAHAEVQAKAARIADADLRQSFLENVPINKAIALATAGRQV